MDLRENDYILGFWHVRMKNGVSMRFLWKKGATDLQWIGEATFHYLSIEKIMRFKEDNWPEATVVKEARDLLAEIRENHEGTETDEIVVYGNMDKFVFEMALRDYISVETKNLREEELS